MAESLASVFLSIVKAETGVLIVPCSDDGVPGMDNLSYEITLEDGMLMNRVTAFDPDTGDIVVQGKAPLAESFTAAWLRTLADDNIAVVRPRYSYATWEHAAA